MFDVFDDYRDQDFLDDLLIPKPPQLQTSKRALEMGVQGIQENEDTKKRRTIVESSDSSLQLRETNATKLNEGKESSFGSSLVDRSYINTDTLGVKATDNSSTTYSRMDLSILDDTDIINVFGEDLNIDINKEVLPKRDQQQNHSTYLYRLTNAASDSHNTSNNYSIQSIKNYESLQKCTSETNARQRIDKSTLESKKTILQEKFEDGNKNSSNKLGKPSVLNGHTKNNEMCLSHTLTPNNILSCDVTTSSKRVFPGPAGALPKLCQNLSAPTSSSRVVTLLNPDLPNQGLDVSNMDISCSQASANYFEEKPWLTMLDDLSIEGTEKNMHLIEKYNVSWVLKQDNRKSFLKGKIPALCVVLHTLVSNPKGDISAVFRDPTGKISGTIHRDLNIEYSSLLKPGCVFVLREIGVFIPTSRKKYLNITPRNIVHIYFLNDESNDNSYLKSDIWTGFVKYVKGILGKPAVLESCKSGFPSLCSPVVPLQKSFSNQDKRHTTRIFPESGTSISANHLYPTNFNHTLSQVPSRTFSDVQKKDIINDSLEVNGTNERSSRILNVPVPFSQDKANYMTESLGLTSNCRTPEVATPVKNSKFTFRPAVSSLSVLPTNDQRRPSNKMSNRHPNDLSTSRSSFDDHLWTDDDFDSVLQEMNG